MGFLTASHISYTVCSRSLQPRITKSKTEKGLRQSLFSLKDYEMSGLSTFNIFWKPALIQASINVTTVPSPPGFIRAKQGASLTHIL